MLTNLDHPNVLKIYETFFEENKVHIVTEYLKGEELFNHIVQMKFIDEHHCATLMK